MQNNTTSPCSNSFRISIREPTQSQPAPPILPSNALSFTSKPASLKRNLSATSTKKWTHDKFPKSEPIEPTASTSRLPLNPNPFESTRRSLPALAGRLPPINPLSKLPQPSFQWRPSHQASQRELNEWARDSWFNRTPYDFGLFNSSDSDSDSEMKVGKELRELVDATGGSWRVKRCIYFPPVQGKNICLGRTCQYAHEERELRLPNGLKFKSPVSRKRNSIYGRSERNSRSLSPPPRRKRIEERTNPSTITLSRSTHNKESPPSFIESSTPPSTFKFTFGYLSPSSASKALSGSNQFENPLLAIQYENFLLSQINFNSKDSKEHYWIRLENLARFNKMMETFQEITERMVV